MCCSDDQVVHFICVLVVDLGFEDIFFATVNRSNLA